MGGQVIVVGGGIQGNCWGKSAGMTGFDSAVCVNVLLLSPSQPEYSPRDRIWHLSANHFSIGIGPPNETPKGRGPSCQIFYRNSEYLLVLIKIWVDTSISGVLFEYTCDRIELPRGKDLRAASRFLLVSAGDNNNNINDEAEKGDINC